MSKLFSIDILAPEFIQALSRTLLHSAWQGMLLAVVAGAIVSCTKRNSPALRYNLLSAALLIFILVVGATFGFEIITASRGNDVLHTGYAAQILSPGYDMVAADANSRVTVTVIAVKFFNAYAGWIVFAWLLIMAVRCVQLTLGLYSVYRIKKIQVSDAGEYWNSRIVVLKKQLQIDRRVRLLGSGIARVPAVVGYFSPVILFPASMLVSLQADEVEAILIHELAHIRRHDFLVNMLQNIVEIIFFFNPAVLWVSSLIKAERENCCDDIAIRHTGGKRNYINALMAFGEINLQQSACVANAFAGKNNHLIDRVKRIIYNNNKTLSNMEKKFLAAAMLLTCLLVIAFSSNIAQPKQVDKQPIIQSSDIAPAKIEPDGLTYIMDTIPGVEAERKELSDETIHTTVNGKEYKMVRQNGQIHELYVDGKKIPAEEMDSYKPETDKIIVQSKIGRREVEEQMEKSQSEMEEAKLSQADAEKQMEGAKLEMELSRKKMELDMVQGKSQLEKKKLEMEQSQKYLLLVNEKLKKEMEQSQKDMTLYKENAEKEMENSRKYMELNAEKIKKEMEQARKDMALSKDQAWKQMEQAKKDMEQSMISMEQSKKEMEKAATMQKNIIEDFITENIIKDKKGLSSYKLNNEELIVNGVKQPAAIYKKFKDKYIKGKEWNMEYNGDGK